MSRPEQIQDNFQACTDHLIAKCQGYREQAETYRNNCIDSECVLSLWIAHLGYPVMISHLSLEFHEQLSLLSNVLVSVSIVVLEEVESHHWSESLTKLASLEADLQGKLAELAKVKVRSMSHFTVLTYELTAALLGLVSYQIKVNNN